MTRDRYHHGNLPRTLIDAALEMIEADGIAVLSLRELAKRAAVSPAAVYRHFADKEGLLAAVAAEGFAALNAAFAAAQQGAGPEPGARLHGLGTAYVTFALGHPGLYRLMFGAGLASRSPYAPLEEQSEQSYSTLVAAIAACSGPDASPAAITAATVAAWSLVHGYVLLRLEGQLAHLPAEALPDAAAVLANLLPKV